MKGTTLIKQSLIIVIVAFKLPIKRLFGVNSGRLYWSPWGLFSWQDNKVHIKILKIIFFIISPCFKYIICKNNINILTRTFADNPTYLKDLKNFRDALEITSRKILQTLEYLK